MIEKRIALLGSAAALITGIVTTSVALDQRYAKSQEVQAQFQQARQQQLRDRIFELDLKPNPTPADTALKAYLQRQLDALK